MSEEWFSLGGSGYCDSQEETLVRIWSPGDGVRCAHASYQRKEPCGPPVAVLRTDQFRFGRTPNQVDAYHPDNGVQKSTTRVVCAEHLAGRVVTIENPGSQARSKAVDLAVKKATDELVAKYWKQYQTLYSKHLGQAMDDLLANIPEQLRPLIAEVIESQSNTEKSA